ncbi:MAG: RnfH family protein [Brachymonas sp.]|jgi:putative ubiquitin-RnfH superfamily antitoxin RatB of RatAB toxin-antitoxin module
MAENGARMTIRVFYSPAPRQVLQHELRLAAGSSVQAAGEMAASEAGWALPKDVRYGVWNKATKDPARSALQDGDRLEIYRPLRVDPMTARRERFKTQGARSAGLFAQRRPGAKPGY